MITEEIDGLIGHIRTTAKVNTSFGLRDLTPSDYPHVRVYPNGSVTVTGARPTMDSVSVSVTVSVVCARENEREALAVFSRVVQALNGYHQSKGHRVAGEGAQEYGPDTFTVSIPYSIKAII